MQKIEAQDGTIHILDSYDPHTDTWTVKCGAELKDIFKITDQPGRPREDVTCKKCAKGI